MELNEDYKVNGIDGKLSVIKIKYDSLAAELTRIIDEMKAKKKDYDDFLQNATEEDIKKLSSPQFDYKIDIEQSRIATEIMKELDGIYTIIDSI